MVADADSPRVCRRKVADSSAGTPPAASASTALGATANDIAWLRLDIIEHRGSGALSEAATVERINTKGGLAQGPCEPAGAYLSVPYSAEYVFLRNNT